MHKRYMVAGYRLLFAAVDLVAMSLQLSQAVGEPFKVANFFSFFTIESNIIVSLLFIVTALALLQDKSDDQFASWRGAATLYMTVTGIIYALFLSGLETSLQTTIPWVNFMLHYLMPLVVLGDWFLSLPGKRIVFKKALWWLAFPLAYVLYSLVRGHFVQWYPYPFLNVSSRGYAAVAVTSVVLAAAFVALTALFAYSTYGKRK